MTLLRTQLRISLAFSASHWKKETNVATSARTMNHHWQLCYLNVNTIHMLAGSSVMRLKAELGHTEWIIALYRAYELRNRYLKRAACKT